jgi:cephalosporin-C deacetylase-like acetyl esterase
MTTMKTMALALGWTCFVWGASASPESIWDLDWAKTEPLEVEIVSEAVETHAGVDVVHRELTYYSHTWNATNIRIAGHLVYPKSAEENPLPAMTLVTASESDARNTALTANVVAFAIHRVGEGGSTGPADDYNNWLDIDEGTDIRNSWMYHYVLSAMRAVTYLDSLDVVKKDAVGITGTSRGGLCALLTSAVDDRIALSVPVAATGDFGTTVEVADNWLESLVIAPTGRTKESVAWKRFVAQYDPLGYKNRFHGLVWIINGAQDEFFPITSTLAMTQGVSTPQRLELIYDADHGYYAQDSGVFDTYNNGPELWKRVTTCLAKAIRTVLHGKGALPDSPLMHELSGGSDSDLVFRASLDERETVVSAQAIYSADGGWTYQRLPLTRGDDGIWSAKATVENPDALAAFVEAHYRDDAGEYFLTSMPVLLKGFVPRIRPAPKF